MYFKRIFCIMIFVQIVFIAPTYQAEIDGHTQKNNTEITTKISVDGTASTTEDDFVDIDHKLLKSFKELYKHIVVNNSITVNQTNQRYLCIFVLNIRLG